MYTSNADGCHMHTQTHARSRFRAFVQIKIGGLKEDILPTLFASHKLSTMVLA